MLIRTGCWIGLELRSKAEALCYVCSWVDSDLRKSAADEVVVSSTQVLKARQAFMSEVDTGLYSSKVDDAAIFGECTMLLAYLTAGEPTEPTSSTQGNISAAMEVVRKISGGFLEREYHHSPACERFLQGAAKLLYWNASNG